MDSQQIAGIWMPLMDSQQIAGFFLGQPSHEKLRDLNRISWLEGKLVPELSTSCRAGMIFSQDRCEHLQDRTLWQFNKGIKNCHWSSIYALNMVIFNGYEVARCHSSGFDFPSNTSNAKSVFAWSLGWTFSEKSWINFKEISSTDHVMSRGRIWNHWLEGFPVLPSGNWT